MPRKKSPPIEQVPAPELEQTAPESGLESVEAETSCLPSKQEVCEVVPDPEDFLVESKKIPPVKHFKRAFVGVAGRLTAAGFTHEYLALAFGVPLSTIYTWKDNYLDFRSACDEGKLHAERQLVARGLRAAGGYTIKSTKTKITKDADGKESTTTEVSDKHFPADPSLLVFFLSNMCRKRACDDWLPSKGIEITSKTLNLNGLPPNATAALSKLAAAFENEEIEKEKHLVESREIKLEEGDIVTPVQ